MMTITGLSHLFKWENLHNWWLTKYFFAPLYNITSYSIKKTIKSIITYLIFLKPYFKRSFKNTKCCTLSNINRY